MTAYFISGLGADRRIFKNLVLPSYIKIHHVEWIEPFSKETLQQYCKRLSAQINSQEEFIFVGLSFGGMVAIELFKTLPAQSVFIISTASTRAELPVWFKFIGALNIHKIVPASLYKVHHPFINWYFGAKTKEEKELLHLFLKSSSKLYLAWSINQILKWNNKHRPDHLFHLHGTDDKIFPYKKTKADVVIKGGDHLMVYDKADQVSSALNEKLNSIYSY